MQRGVVVYVSSGSSALVVGIIAAAAVVVAALITAAVARKVGATSARTTLAIANEDRRQDRIRAAYVTIQIYLAGWSDIARWYGHKFRFSGEAEPSIPKVNDEAQAVAALFASTDVVREVEKFSRAVALMRVAIGSVESLREMEVHKTPAGAETLRELNASLTYRAGEVTRLAESVHQILRSELNRLSENP